MPTIVQALARSPWRVGLVLDASFGGITTPTTYSFTRLDNAGTTVTATAAFLTDALSVDLGLSEALVEGVIYVLAAAGVTGTAQVSYRSPLPQAVGAPALDDPEAEAFGVDLDWLAPALGPDGDVPQIRGRACLINDLMAIAATVPGELYHRPTEGAGLPERVNGPSDPEAMQAALTRTWLRDPRVKKVSATVRVSSNGEVSAQASVRTVALDEPVQVLV